MVVFGLAGTLAFLLVSAVLGVRLLRLFARTRALPELTMAIAFLGHGFLGFALSVLAKGLHVFGPSSLLVVVMTGHVAQYVGALAIGTFAWRVFRPQGGGALVYAALALALGGALGAEILSGAYRDYASVVPYQGWYSVGHLVRVSAHAWLVTECLIAWRKARRRARLGLAEPIVVERFAIWAASSSAVVLAVLVATEHRLRTGYGVVASPPAMATVSALLLAAALGNWLCFFPPRWYRARFAADTERGDG
jgi:hypothetical protein